MEDFSVHHGVSSFDTELTTNENHNTFISSWLHIHSGNLVFNFAEWAEFFIDTLLSEELFTFESQHRLVGVKTHKVFSWLIKLSIEVINELGTNICEIWHFLLLFFWFGKNLL